MSSDSASPPRCGYATRAAGWVQIVIVRDEELHPLPEAAQPGMLLARVTERIAQASHALRRYEGRQGSCGGAEQGDENAVLLAAGIYLLGAAAFAISAVPRLLPDDAVATTELKDALLEELDARVEACRTDPEGTYATATADVWPARALSLLIGACQGVCELQGVAPLRSLLDAGEGDPLEKKDAEAGDDLSEDAWFDDFVRADEDLDDDEDDENALDQDLDWLEERLTAIADSLMDAAAVAAAGGQWCIERHEQLERPAFAS